MNTTEFKGVEITWFGHSSFKLKSNAGVVYIDPYVLPAGEEAADVVVMTHEHFDHCAVESAGKVMRPSTVIVTTQGCARRCSGDVRVVKAGDGVEVGEIKVEAVEAYNRAKPFHPRGLGVGVIVSMQGVRIYHAGDTDFIAEMSNIKTEVALLPIGGHYTMDEREAAEAALALKPSVAIPMHYNYIPQTSADPELFRRLIAEKDESIEVRILD
ncbi:MBL fold metallo-hydrolase [Candidatus Pyrohabitans sp.]